MKSRFESMNKTQLIQEVQRLIEDNTNLRYEINSKTSNAR
jgi:hypothetical protein